MRKITYKFQHQNQKIKRESGLLSNWDGIDDIRNSFSSPNLDGYHHSKILAIKPLLAI